MIDGQLPINEVFQKLDHNSVPGVIGLKRMKNLFFSFIRIGCHADSSFVLNRSRRFGDSSQ
jgi:hypothetical protein